MDIMNLFNILNMNQFKRCKNEIVFYYDDI